MARIVSDAQPTNPKKRKKPGQKRVKKDNGKKMADLITQMQQDHKRLVKGENDAA